MCTMCRHSLRRAPQRGATMSTGTWTALPMSVAAQPLAHALALYAFAALAHLVLKALALGRREKLQARVHSLCLFHDGRVVHKRARRPRMSGAARR